MYVVIYDNQVVLGPMRWNRARFENFLFEEYELSVRLPDSNSGNCIVNDNCKIFPIQGTENPPFNPKIEMLHGPFWEITDSVAISSYEVVKMPVDAVKNNLKAVAAGERWRKETSGVKVNINGTEYSFGSDKETRSVLQHALATDTDQFNWKFGTDNWVTLSKNDITTIISTILTHVQECFDWEYSKINEINSCTTLEELDAIEIVQPVEMDLPGIV